MTASRAASFHAGAPDRVTIVRSLRELYNGSAWHGPSLRATLRGVTADLATQRIAPGRNTIWELVLHVAYSRHRLIGRVETRKVDRFPRALRKNWWPVAPNDSSDAAWRADLALLDDFQNRLIASVERAPAARLARVRVGQKRTIAHELLGNAFHDAYHAGQIKLLALELAARPA